jgi:hypothetical protein
MRPPLRRSRKFVVAGALAAVIGVSVATLFYAARESSPEPKVEVAAVPSAIGFIDRLVDDGHTIEVSGWALSAHGIREATLVLNGNSRHALRTGVSRPDVARVHPHQPFAANSGFEGTVAFTERPTGPVTVELVLTDNKGQSARLASRTLAPAGFRETWQGLLGQRPAKPDDVFYLLMATSNVAGGDADGIDTTFRPYESDTVKVGMRVQILYMRTTKGPAHDYAFDPDFSPEHKCGDRTIAEDSLNSVIRYSIARRLPVLFTLNAGFWADAACDAPQWDVNDYLEQDVSNNQWNEKGKVMADDYLKSQPGSIESPELGRGLTFNFHAKKNRLYKKRNLMQAAAVIRKFATAHPDLFVGIALDPDLYMNPFFEGKQWYDYNPGTIRQFREWLRGVGAYEAGGPASQPGPLAAYRRKKPLQLDEVNELSGRKFKGWGEVDPPRQFPVRINKFWEDPWVREWEHFRRHVVDLHYDELSQWLREAGFPKRFVFSSQGFMAPGPLIQPFPIRLDSPAKNYDTGGVSVEGAVPAHGHLGAILYAASAMNQIPMEGERSLFATFRQFDPGWAVVEYNTADLLQPGRLADFDAAYQSLRDLSNYGARFVSPMAWNGSPGTTAGTSDFIGYTALRETPLEDAIRHFMISRANLPRQARLWTFGTSTHADADGWTGAQGTAISTSEGKLMPKPAAGDAGAIESPGELDFDCRDYGSLIIHTDAPPDTTRIGVEARQADGKWVALVPEQLLSEAPDTPAGRVLALPDLQQEFVRLRITWQGAGPSLGIQHIALYPR